MAKNRKQNHQQDNQKEVSQEEKEQQFEVNEQETNTPSRFRNSPTGFVSRVSSIPVVQDSLFTVQALANKTSLGRLALSTGSFTLTTMSKYTHSQPKYVQSYYESYIQPHMETVDAFGCRSLDLIETNFPVVTQPTEDIFKAVTVPSYQVVNDVKVKLDTTFTQPAHNVAKQANLRLGLVVNNVESVLNNYLPPPSDVKRAQGKDENQALRVYALLNDLSHRLSLRIQEQVKPIPRGLAHLAENSVFIQRVTENIQSLESYGQHLPRFVIEHFEGTQEKLQTLVGLVFTQTQQIVNYLRVQSTEVPDWLKSRVHSLVDIASRQVDLVLKEYERDDISPVNKTKNIARDLQSQVFPLLETISAQLDHYSQLTRQKVSYDLKTSFEYLGLTHAPKATHTQ
ncbi:unnamed protein product [Rhizopus stolonifer]